MNTMMKVKTHTAAPRYPFGLEHRASVEFDHSGKRFCAMPMDISRDHICVRMAPDASCLQPGVPIADVVIKIMGKRFDVPGLVLTTVRMDDDEELRQFVFSAVGNAESCARLWEVSYLLRTVPGSRQEKKFDLANLPKVPARGIYTEEARQERLAFMREEAGLALEEVAHTRLDPPSLVSNIEALIGSVEIPLGIAGPLLVRGQHSNGLYYAPMATSEGALVASATRGATAISRSGGVRARVLEQRMLRVPVFTLNTMENAFFFAEWVKDHQQEIREVVSRYSNYAHLRELHAQVIGHSAHIHFVYETGDAAGQNMTTTCTWQACQWIMKRMQQFEQVEFENFLIEANLSNDKKVTWQSYLKGRGIRVIAETLLTAEHCKRVLKVEPEQLMQSYHTFIAGSVAAGMVGININVANVIAAMFTATGQDIACVHESSLAQLHMELTADGDVYATMTLPSMVIGTVGGGTNLPQQKECLAMLGCAGPGKAHKLAEIIASWCLALDLSTLSAIASDQFARAHEKLGRNRPVEWLKRKDLDDAFFAEHASRTGLAVQSAEEIPSENMGSSIITELTAHKINKLVGHFPYRLHTETGDVDVMVKVKPLDDEVILMLNSMAAMCDARLAQEFNRFKNSLGFKGCHVREIGVMSQTDERFTRHAPVIHGTLADPSREAYLLIEEKLEGLELMDSADDTSDWTREHVEAAIRGIAEVHSIWYGREEELCQQEWLVDYPTRDGMLEKRRLWEMLGAHALEEFPEFFSERDMQIYRTCLSQMERWWDCIEKQPRTLIHNDFNPRNIAFRREDGELRLCAYDWELATLHLPQHDLAELLMFTLFDPIDPAQVEHYIELHRVELEKHTGQAIDPRLWRKGYYLSLLDLLVNRVPMYVMAHTFRHYKFMERTVRAFRELLRIEGANL
jgi:NADP-dependent 3-hydroxy-3-methylglutaryl-CoA reductase